jgi:hypothetical protein
MSFQLVGQVVGSAFGPFGSLIGGMIGGAIDQSFAPDGPGAGDLTAPGLQLGRQLPRVYGRVRLPCNPIWASEFRATEHSSGGKGGPPGPSSYTYSLDMLCAVADGSNVIAVTRIWVNKKLVYTALTDSSDDSIVYSQGGWLSVASGIVDGPSAWSSFELLTGGPSQVPFSTYEDAVGAANAPAYRNLCTIGFNDLQCGGSKTPPVIEVEVITAGTPSDLETSQPPEVVGSTQGTGTSPTPVTGVQSGDAVVLCIHMVSGTPTMDTAAYTLVESGQTSSGGSKIWVFGRTADGTSADEELSFTVGGGATVGYWGVIAVRSEDDALFLDPTSTSVTLDGNPSAGGITKPSGAYQFAIAGAYIDVISGDATLLAPPDGYTTYAQGAWNWVTGMTTVDAEVMLSYKIVTGLSENPGDFDDGPGGYGGGGYGALTFVFTAHQGAVYEKWAPDPVYLDDIISAELQLNPEVPTTDFDVTDLSAIEVIGYTAAGSQARTVQELCEVHYVDVVPGNPNRFQRRGTTSVSTIAFIDTGAGANDPSDPFSGLRRGNADEIPAVAAIRFPLIDKDHEAGYERGDRLSTDSDDVRTIETRVVMGAEKAKGRAITATLLDRVRRHTTQFALSDKYAKAEPADVYTPEDNDGNSYRLRIRRFSYADGVKSMEWELDDTTALIETGLTDTSYTPSIEIVPPGVAEVLPLDIPLQRVQDDNPGYLAAVKCSDESRVYFLESPSDTTYTEVAQFPLDAVFGTVSAITGTPSIVATDTGCSVTVDVGDGTLAAITDATLLLDNTANRFVIGAYGREVIGQFRDCTLSAPGVYVISGFLWGLSGTGQYVNDLTAGDHFCVLNESGGVKHIDRTSAQLGVAHYIKAVPERRSQASITGEAFTNSGVALKPLAGINPHAERDAGSGDITLTWDRQTRHPTRFGGDLGDSTPLGEESERYQVRLYTDNTFATMVRAFDVSTTTEVVYTSAQRTADSHSPITAALYVDVRQISATVGEGYALQATL